ncbi:MAG: DNA glycosylase [Candidatus Ranarchaeia archaeon]
MTHLMKKEGKIFLKKSENINLFFTLTSGQTFRWEKKGEYWVGILDNTEVSLKKEKNFLFYRTVGKGFSENKLKKYLGLEHNLKEIYSRNSSNDFLEDIFQQYSGLRILKQKPWETLGSFILSSCNNILRIRKMIDTFSTELGTNFQGENDSVLYAFPTAKQISSSSENELRKMGLGYRAKYIFETAKIILENGSILDQDEGRTYQDIFSDLLSLPGVGQKIADCVTLFGFEKFEAFPIDTHIFQVLKKKNISRINELEIKSLTPGNYKKIKSWSQQQFGDFAGYVQQYLYLWDLETKKMIDS